MGLDQLSVRPPVAGDFYAGEPIPENLLRRLERVEGFIDSAPAVVGFLDGDNVVQDGVYLAVQAAEGDNGATAGISDFDLLPGAQMGAADSHHEVLFGRVIFHGEVIDVAIKSFDADSHLAEREARTLNKVREMGFLAFQPLAVARDRDESYLVTARMDNVETLDNVNWTVKAGTEEFEKEVVPELRFIATYLADMHIAGLFHGDAQPKNIGRDDVGRRVYVDLEEAIIPETPEEYMYLLTGGWDVNDSKALKDVVHCWWALLHPTKEGENNIMFIDEDIDTCMDAFKTQLLSTYLERLKSGLPEVVSDKVDWAAFEAAMIQKVLVTT